jgi:ABC-type dipeptide/oligopeptide/nickel transport system permease component
MLSYVLKRFLQSILVMLFVAFVCFVLSNYVGDPVNNMVGQEATIKDRAALRQELGLNDPIVFQFGRFGTSSRRGFRQPWSSFSSRPSWLYAWGSPAAFTPACTGITG